MSTSASDAQQSAASMVALPRVSFVIPTLNEAKNLPHILPRIPTWAFETIIVDGLSSDGTPEIARQLLPDVIVINETRRGKGAALQAGFRAARGDIIIMLDADGSMAPEEAMMFVGALMAGADVVKGSRRIPGAGSDDLSIVRMLGNIGLTWAVRLLFRTYMTDLCYGYMAFWSRHVPVMDCDCPGFEIETLLNLRALRHNLRMVEVASFESPRLYGESNLRAIPDGLRVLRTILREWTASRAPALPPVIVEEPASD